MQKSKALIVYNFYKKIPQLICVNKHLTKTQLSMIGSPTANPLRSNSGKVSWVIRL